MMLANAQKRIQSSFNNQQKRLPPRKPILLLIANVQGFVLYAMFWVTSVDLLILFEGKNQQHPYKLKVKKSLYKQDVKYIYTTKSIFVRNSENIHFLG